MIEQAYVYILTSKRNGTLYIGVTTNIIKRIYQHKKGMVPGFTRKYGVNQLVYYESTPSIITALEREKQLKRWNRIWKLQLIEKFNPNWIDLYNNICS